MEQAHLQTLQLGRGAGGCEQVDRKKVSTRTTRNQAAATTQSARGLEFTDTPET